MVGAVEQEPHAAGQRTELSDNQPVAVHGIVVQHVVALETDGVGRKIVIYRIFPDFDVGVADDLLQIDRLPVPFTGINLTFCSHFHALFCRGGISATSSRSSAIDYCYLLVYILISKYCTLIRVLWVTK